MFYTESLVKQITFNDIPKRPIYARQRPLVMAKMAKYLKTRRIEISQDVSLLFENSKTVKHQISEVMYWECTEKSFNEYRFNSELANYQKLIPSNSTLKASLMITAANASRGFMIGDGLITNEVFIELTIGSETIKGILIDEFPDPSDPIKFLAFQLTEAAIEQLSRGYDVKVWLKDKNGHVECTMMTDTKTSIMHDILSESVTLAVSE